MKWWNKLKQKFKDADNIIDFSVDIIIVISSKNKEHSLALLEKLNFPFIKKGDN